jgi:glycine/D-amino acid oxidase-like deaminating enzyme
MSHHSAPVQKVETLIIGAGLIGSSVAMHLARMGERGIRVVDFDLEGSLSSSELNAGGVRATFGQACNIEMSRISINYFASVAKEVGYRPCGYLWLKTPETLPSALKARELQQKMGWEVQAWDVAELRRRVPFIDKTDDLAGAVFAPRDGLVNPNLLKNHYRAKARELGVVFEDRTWVTSAESMGQGGGIRVVTRQLHSPAFHEAKLSVFAGRPEMDGLPWTGARFEARRVINCAGPWAPQIAKLLGYSCPSHPVRRQVCIFDCRDVDLTPFGMMVDPSGVYFHPEASNGLAGFAQTGEQAGVNYHYDGESFFEEFIWPSLYERSTKFERLKHLTGWAGLYEVSPDESAIIGEVVGSSFASAGRIFEAHSFSGHGAMHSYGAGLALAEKIVRNRYETVDAGVFSAGRFSTGELLHEQAVI